MSPTVTVILPTYNRLHCLGAAIDSVLTQSFRDLELIVVDDGSPQDVRGLVASIDDPRVRTIRRERNGGAAAARNSGLAAARGDFIAFQDSDDLWLPGKLQRQMDLLARLPAEFGVVTAGKLLYGRDDAFVYGQGRVSYAPPLAGRLKPGDDQRRRMMSENRISLQNTLFRRSCYPGLVWFDPLARGNEDWEFAVRLTRHTTVYEDARPEVIGFSSVDSICRNPRKECSGLLRIIAGNRDMLDADPALRARLFLELARLLHRCGRRRIVRRLMIASVRLQPSIALSIARSLAGKAWQRLRGPVGSGALVAGLDRSA